MAGAMNRGTEFGEPRTGQMGSASGAMEAVRERAQEFTSNVATQAEEAWDSTKQRAQQVASTLATTAEDAWGNVNAFFGRYGLPMFCVGIGLGFLLARAFANMTSDIPERMAQSSQYRY